MLVNYNASNTSANNSPNTQTLNTHFLAIQRGTIGAAAGDFVFNTPFNLGNGSSNTCMTDGAHDFYMNYGVTGTKASWNKSSSTVTPPLGAETKHLSYPGA